MIPFRDDEVGNLVTDAVTDAGTTTFTYDAANRLTRSDYAEDTDGASPVTTYYGWGTQNAWRTCQGPNPSPTQANSPIDLSYNALGRMSAYADSAANTSALYTYDASGQRVKKEVTVAGTTTTTSFAYDGLTLMKLSATQGGSSWRIDYLYDEEGTVWGGVYRSPAGSMSPTFFSLITSDRDDVLELCDADGNPFAAYRYDAWGSPQGAGSYAPGIWTQSTALVTSTLAGEIASRQVLRYAAYAWDAESALYYCSARYYDPATRQWTTGDPAKADGEESAYQYCGGEPVGSVDHSGEKRINVPRVRQNGGETSMLCWDACTVSVVKWYYPKSTVNQKKVCEYLYGSYSTTQGSDPAGVAKALRAWRVGCTRKGAWITPTMTYPRIKEMINKKRPIMAYTNPTSLGTLHVVVICGYCNYGGEKAVIRMEPGDGRYHVWKWSTYKEVCDDRIHQYTRRLPRH